MVGIYIVLAQFAWVSGDAFENFGRPPRLKTDSTDFVKFRPRRWVSNPFASSILLTVDRSGLRIHAS